MATRCPVCENGNLKKTESMVKCSNRKTEKVDGGFKEVGSCDFRINFNQKKVFGQDLTPADIKKMVDGENIFSKKGHKMFLDLKNKDFFTKIEFAKEVEEDL